MSRYAVVAVAELGPHLTLAPERFSTALPQEGVALSDLVREVRTRVRLPAGSKAIVIDTTHVRDGAIEVPAPSTVLERDARKVKIAVPPGALLISRLRPYLRQVGLVTPALVASRADRRDLVWACSTEFSVLASRDERDSLAFLLPFLLSPAIQARLAAAQEGAHRPRVPRETVLTIHVPRRVVVHRRRTSARVERALEALDAARTRLRRIVG